MCQKDYFEYVDELPENVKAILKKFQGLENTYEECSALVDALWVVNWTCDYDLNAILYGLRPIKEEELKFVEQ